MGGSKVAPKRRRCTVYVILDVVVVLVVAFVVAAKSQSVTCTMLSSCSYNTVNDEKCAKMVHTHTYIHACSHRQLRRDWMCEKRIGGFLHCLYSLATCIDNANILNQSSDCRKRQNWCQLSDAFDNPYSTFPATGY